MPISVLQPGDIRPYYTTNNPMPRLSTQSRQATITCSLAGNYIKKFYYFDVNDNSNQ